MAVGPFPVCGVFSHQVYCQAGGETYDVAVCGGNLVCTYGFG